ncbi:unnamed protein product [Hermetia illucens]|uniref:Uncharacterized protein n=1 Tax=Hermetia illucens TaxID=343691 RepID=A0A7R8YP25_HERIL|nr:uncharacterized protein LOC119660911 [Hermetia illucens]CAD7080193.1 unnamed protein product [Hermetia illucens]
MFQRKKQLGPPPSAPTVTEIIEDLETFHVEKPLLVKTRSLDPEGSSDAEWWKVFETFLSDVDDLKRLKALINSYKIKLEASKLEIDTTAKNLQIDIEKHLEGTRKEIKE